MGEGKRGEGANGGGGLDNVGDCALQLRFRFIGHKFYHTLCITSNKQFKVNKKYLSSFIYIYLPYTSVYYVVKNIKLRTTRRKWDLDVKFVAPGLLGGAVDMGQRGGIERGANNDICARAGGWGEANI